jgi:uncharacterized protein YcbK (DUF882 family)
MGDTNPSSRRSLHLPRRTFIGAGLSALGLFATNPALAARPPATSRVLSFQNLHTGETTKSEYWVQGTYLPEALQRINHVLRDHRTDAVHAIDKRLLDALHHLHAKLDVRSGFQVISGYRSPQSNAKLAAASGGVATRSLHMDGMAIDIRVPGVDLRHVHKAAKSLAVGGVGYYASSNFVHMDVGRVRSW